MLCLASLGQADVGGLHTKASEHLALCEAGPSSGHSTVMCSGFRDNMACACGELLVIYFFILTLIANAKQCGRGDRCRAPALYTILPLTCCWFVLMGIIVVWSIGKAATCAV